MNEECKNIIINLDTMRYYSTSEKLRNACLLRGRIFDNTCESIEFAKNFTDYYSAVRKSQQLSNRTGCVHSVMSELTTALATKILGIQAVSA